MSAFTHGLRKTCCRTSRGKTRILKNGDLPLRCSVNPPRPFVFFLLAAAVTLTPIHIQAQNAAESSGDSPQPVKSSSSFSTFFRTLHPQTSISLGTFGQFTPTRLAGNPSEFDNFFTNGMSPTVGVLGTFRQQFRPWLGYSLNMGYTRVTERYTANAPSPGGGGSLNAFGNEATIHNNMYELSLSYVARKQLTPRLSGFAEVGAGAVTFLPIFPASAARYNPDTGFIKQIYGPPVNFRPEGVGGVGIHLHLANSFGLNVEYRGLIYKEPDFGLNLQKSTTLTSEPTVSLTYSFGHK